MTRNDASRVDPVPAVDQRPQGAPSRSTPATPLTAPPAVPQPTPAALAALDEFKALLGRYTDAFRGAVEEEYEAGRDVPPTRRNRSMCDNCGDETIHHVEGERGVDRETCWCRCHDRREPDGHLLCGADRGDEAAAATACERCRWAHVVAYSTANWRNDERYMTPPEGPQHG